MISKRGGMNLLTVTAACLLVCSGRLASAEKNWFTDAGDAAAEVGNAVDEHVIQPVIVKPIYKVGDGVASTFSIYDKDGNPKGSLSHVAGPQGSKPKQTKQQQKPGPSVSQPIVEPESLTKTYIHVNTGKLLFQNRTEGPCTLQVYDSKGNLKAKHTFKSFGYGFILNGKNGLADADCTVRFNTSRKYRLSEVATFEAIGFKLIYDGNQ